MTPETPSEPDPHTSRDPRLDETFIAGLHLPVAFLFITAASLHLVLEGADYASVLVAALLAGQGGFTVLIVGTSRMLITGLTKHPLVARRLALVPGILVALGALFTVLSFTHETPTIILGTIMWALGFLGHIVIVRQTLERIRSTHADSKKPRNTPNKTTRRLLVVTILLGLLAAIWLPVTSITDRPVLPALHLLLAGFITLAIITSLHELVPRFTRRPLPHWWGRTVLVTGPLGALLLPAGFQMGTAVLHAGATLLVITLVLTAYGLTHMIAHTRRRRGALALYGCAVVFLLFGTFLGAGVAYYQLTPRWVPLHGVMNLLGFLGVVSFAASVDLYGPALRRGRRAQTVHVHTITVLIALSMVAFPLLEIFGHPAARFLLIPYALAAVLHTVAAVVRLYPALKRRAARAGPAPR